MKVKITKTEPQRFFFSGSVVLIPGQASGEFDVTEAELGPLQSTESLNVIRIEYLETLQSLDDKLEETAEEAHREEVSSLLDEAEDEVTVEEIAKSVKRKKKL